MASETKESRWSPADLARQRLVVRRIRLRSEFDLRTLAAARARMVAAVHNQIGVPLVLAGCFAVGMMVRPRAPPQREAVTALRPASRLRHLMNVLRIVTMGATVYSALFRGNRESSFPVRKQEIDSLPPVAQE